MEGIATKKKRAAKVAPEDLPRVEHSPKWKLAKGKWIGLPLNGAVLKITDESLSKPSVLRAIDFVERQTGIRVFGVSVIEA